MQKSETLSFFQACRQILSGSKHLNNRLFNILGGQVFRLFAARAALKLRRIALTKPDTPIVNPILENGIVVLPDFLDGEDFEKVLREFNDLKGNADHFPEIGGPDVLPDHDGVINIHIEIDDGKVEFYPTFFEKIFFNPDVLDAISYYEGISDVAQLKTMRFFNAVDYVEQVEDPRTFDDYWATTTRKSAGDPHADTFHSTTKMFFYLYDVPSNNGPFYYAKKSHKLDWERIKWTYLNSIYGQTNFSGITYNNTRDKKELETAGYEFMPCAVKKNTMIIVDTFGWHARGPMAEKGMKRAALHISCRRIRPII